MEYLVKEEKLELKYQPGKGAWTYHIQIPNTKHIVGKWGTMKVSGTIDNYKIESVNLAKLGGEDKLISINSKIRKAINKNGGDTVTVTLYLLTSQLFILTQKWFFVKFGVGYPELESTTFRLNSSNPVLPYISLFLFFNLYT